MKIAIDHLNDTCTCRGKRCPKRGHRLCILAFAKNKSTKDGLRQYCKQCDKEWLDIHREENNRRMRINGTYRKAKLKELYGITPQQWEILFISQHGLCAICSKELKRDKTTHVDHSHTTEKVRGLLCKDCNTGLGHFFDNTENLEKALAYLSSFNIPLSEEKEGA
jgi:hypothetical protein